MLLKNKSKQLKHLERFQKLFEQTREKHESFLARILVFTSFKIFCFFFFFLYSIVATLPITVKTLSEVRNCWPLSLSLTLSQGVYLSLSHTPTPRTRTSCCHSQLSLSFFFFLSLFSQTLSLSLYLSDLQTFSLPLYPEFSHSLVHTHFPTFTHTYAEFLFHSRNQNRDGLNAKDVGGRNPFLRLKIQSFYR